MRWKWMLSERKVNVMWEVTYQLASPVLCEDRWDSWTRTVDRHPFPIVRLLCLLCLSDVWWCATHYLDHSDTATVVIWWNRLIAVKKLAVRGGLNYGFSIFYQALQFITTPPIYEFWKLFIDLPQFSKNCPNSFNFMQFSVKFWYFSSYFPTPPIYYDPPN